MGKFILATILLFTFPVTAYAANDVTLTTDTIISVGGYTLNVSGSSAVIDSIVVDESNLSVTLSSGSSITISSPTRNQLSSDVTSDVSASTCDNSASSITLSYSGAGTVTNVITPSATICVTTVTASSGGGAAFPVNVSQPPIAPINVPVDTQPASLDAVNSNKNQTAIQTGLIYSGFVFKKLLTVGSTGTDVKQLQTILKKLGYFTYPKITGYFGLITKQAVIKFQKAYKLKPYPGWVGPATRIILNKILLGLIHL